MKTLTVLFSALFLLAAQSSQACVPFNSASYDAAFIGKAIASKAFQSRVYDLGSESTSRIVSINKEGNTVTVALNDNCGITVKGTPVEPKEGERACMNFEFTAQAYCQ